MGNVNFASITTPPTLHRFDGYQMVIYSNAANLGGISLNHKLNLPAATHLTSIRILAPSPVVAENYKTESNFRIVCELHSYIYRVQKMDLCLEN